MPEPTKMRERTPASTGQKFFTAGLAGCMGWGVVHPFNTCAVRMNLATVKGQSFGSFFMQSVRKPGGLKSLYDGLSAGLIRQMFYASSRFALFEILRDEAAKHTPTTIWTRLGVGCVSGAAAALISTPAETTLVRLSNDSSLPKAEQRGYKGVTDAFLRIFREEGPKAFFAASGPFMNRAVLVGMVQVGTLDQFKVTYRETLGITGVFQNTFCSAMSSGLLYALVTMPLETAKNRIAFQKPDAKTGEMLYRGAVQTVMKIAKDEAPKALYSGFAPYYLRCGGHTVSMFIFLEMIRQAMNIK